MTDEHSTTTDTPRKDRKQGIQDPHGGPGEVDPGPGGPDIRPVTGESEGPKPGQPVDEEDTRPGETLDDQDGDTVDVLPEEDDDPPR